MTVSSALPVLRTWKSILIFYKNNWKIKRNDSSIFNLRIAWNSKSLRISCAGKQGKVKERQNNLIWISSEQKKQTNCFCFHKKKLDILFKVLKIYDYQNLPNRTLKLKSQWWISYLLVDDLGSVQIWNLASIASAHRQCNEKIWNIHNIPAYVLTY